MSIRIATVGRQRTIAGLAKSLLGGKAAPSEIEAAVEALKRANPTLDRPNGVVSGAKVIVPGKLRAASESAEDPAGELSTLALARARALGALFEAPLKTAVEAARIRAADAKAAATVKAILSARPDLEPAIKEMQKKAADEAVAVEAAAEELRRSAKTLLSDLEGGGGRPA